MHILLVEPDVLSARTYTEAFTKAGHTVSHVRSAQAAIHEADLRCPDVVVLELQLPHHNGIEFLYEFRSYSEWQHVPVVVHSFVPVLELSQAPTLTKELGVVRVLYKPDTTLTKLCTTVRTVTAAVI